MVDIVSLIIAVDAVRRVALRGIFAMVFVYANDLYIFFYAKNQENN